MEEKEQIRESKTQTANKETAEKTAKVLREKQRERLRLAEAKRKYFDFYDDIKTNGNESW